MYLIIEYILSERVKMILRVPRPEDFTKETHWLRDETELNECLREIAKKNELDLTNEEDVEQLDSMVDIIPYTSVQLPSDILIN
jgi:hypothetical protein